MRSMIAALAFAAVLFGATAAQAEKRVFIIANNADGYGVDRCLASGAACGEAAANSYCRSHEFARRCRSAKSIATTSPARSRRAARLLPRRKLRQLRRHRLLAVIEIRHARTRGGRDDVG